MLAPSSIQALAPDDYFKLLAVLIIIAIVGTFELFRNLIRARIIEDTPTSRIRSAAQGYVEVIGRCEPFKSQIITAPLSRNDCLWYRYQIEKYQASSKGGRWRTVEDASSDNWFIVNDETDTCAVNPDGADITTRIKEVWYGHSRWPESGMRTGSMRLGAPYRYTEERLLEGDPAYILGNYRTLRTDRRKEKNRRVGAWLAELKKDKQRLLEVYDTNRDGEVDVVEWEAARRNALRHAEQAQAKEDQQAPLSVIGKTGTARRPFLIASHSQRVLARRYRRRSAVAALAALAGNSLTIWLIFARFFAV